jgi:hypothetical protein
VIRRRRLQDGEVKKEEVKEKRVGIKDGGGGAKKEVT